MKDKFEQEAWKEFTSKPFDPTFDWEAVAESRRKAAARAASGETNVVHLFPNSNAAGKK